MELSNFILIEIPHCGILIQSEKNQLKPNWQSKRTQNDSLRNITFVLLKKHRIVDN